MTTHLKVLGVLFVAFGAVLIVLAAFSSLLIGALAGFVGASDADGAEIGGAILGLAGAALAAAMLAYAVPCVVCGWGLLTRRSWARVLGIVLAFIALIRPPFGTLFGIYALIILFNKQTEDLLSPGKQQPG